MPRNEKDSAELDILIAKLHVAAGKSADEMTLEVYSEALDDIPMATLRATITTAIKTCKFTPTVAELRILAGFDMTTENRAVTAFAALGKAVEVPGSYRSIRFADDPVLNQTISDLGGWVHVCDTKNDEWHTHFRHRFIKTYAANCDSRRGTTTAQLGISAMENVKVGGMSKFDQPVVEFHTKLPKLDRLSYDPPKTDKRLGLSSLGNLLKDARQGDEP